MYELSGVITELVPCISEKPQAGLEAKCEGEMAFFCCQALPARHQAHSLWLSTGLQARRHPLPAAMTSKVIVSVLKLICSVISTKILISSTK